MFDFPDEWFIHIINIDKKLLFKNIKKLNFSNSIYINDENILDIIKHFPDLEEINLSNCKNISENCIKNIDSEIKLIYD